MNNIAAWALQVILIPALAPLGVGLINVIKARLQRRSGSNILQPYRNIVKLFHKDEVISRDASWIMRVAPYVVIGTVMIVAASIPLFTTVLTISTGDLLMVVCLMGLGTFFLALSGMDAGSSFGGFGSSREMTLAAMAEGAWIFAALPLVILAGSTDLHTIVGTVTIGSFGSLSVPLVLAFAGLYIVLLAESSRYPFDNPDTHLELTMIHEAMLLEYSGKRLALMEWASAIKLMVMASLAVNMFFPGGIAMTSNMNDIVIGLAVWVAKVVLVYVSIAMLESFMAKLRFFRLPDLFAVSFILSAIAVGLVI